MVFIDGILQKSSTNYSLNTSTGVVTFTSAPDNGAEIEVKHLGIRTTARRAVSMFLDNFTGNGSTTAFTLSNNASVNDVFVFYNGVCNETNNGLWYLWCNSYVHLYTSK